MKVIVGAYAWLPKAELSKEQMATLRDVLTVHPKKVGDHPGEVPAPIPLYRETDELFGMAREFFMARRKSHHEIDFRVTEGNRDTWPGDLTYTTDPKKQLRPEQAEALQVVLSEFREKERLGGIVRAVPGWGKTIWACSLIHALQVPTLVVVHKEFLMDQWVTRLTEFLPNAKIGIVQSDSCEYKDRHVSIGMVHSLAERDYGDEFYRHFGLILTDECHRVGSATWSAVPPKFPARWRIGLSATPRRKDGADRVFFEHIGQLLFAAKEKRLKPQVRRVWTGFKLAHTPNFNPALGGKSILLKFLCASPVRNKCIIDQLILAIKAKRKVLVLSERLKHLHKLEELTRKAWEGTGVELPTMGYYVGGMTKEALDHAATCQVIFATSQLVTEGLDIPSIDTLFLTTPLADVEQAVGRILRPSEGKKDPVVVDFREEDISLSKRYAEFRDRQYERMIA